MNKFVAASILSALVGVSASALANDGTINFTGEVIDTACTVDIGANNTMEVALGKVAKSAFTGVDSTASATEFDLKLKDCPAEVTSAVVKFDGLNYEGDNETLALTDEEGVATGVGIQLKDASQTLVPLFAASSKYDLVTGENTLPFYASYVQKEADVTAGKANSTVQFTLNYN